MLRFALAHGNTLLAERGARLLAEYRPGTPREAFRLLCILLVPLDEDSRTAARLGPGNAAGTGAAPKRLGVTRLPRATL